LGQRIAEARGDLAHAAGALRPSLLDRKLDRARDRLEAIRLTDRPIRARIADGQVALERLWRIAEQLHPDKPLQRGYVRVEKRGGGVLTDAATARAAGLLTLHFADGALDARVENGGKAPAAKPRSDGEDAPRQQNLF
ncbi:exodeoxyribonuclease VII large subunit, partial [Rhizorhabdus histidinilytica]